MFQQLYQKLADLPVAKQADRIADSVLGSDVTILSAETGSGKTLYSTAKLAEIWKHHKDNHMHQPLLVLVPRRFLAYNAAKTIADLSGTELGEEVGYAMGRRAGEESKFSDKTKIIFATYGYALSSKLLETAPAVVLDEVHERDMDIALSRALLHDRLANRDKVKVLEMSATIDANKQAEYWKQVAPTTIFEVEGKAYPCERREAPEGSIADTAAQLIKEGRHGILIFRPGMREIKDTIEQLQQTLDAQGIRGVEIAHIHGALGPRERQAAMAPPKDGHVKILIGTNVIESGANIPWVDAGISCGTGKQKNVDHRTGAHSLDLEILPQWRLIQQEGRVKRFKPGIFVLASDTKWNDRPLETTPEIERLPLTDILMQALRYGLTPEQTVFDPPLDPKRVAVAKSDLMRLGLVDEEFQPTMAGKFAETLPVSADAAAMLWHAKQLGVLKAALPVAALMMTGSIREDYKRSHGKDETSDLMDAVKAFVETTKTPDRATFERLNVNYQQFQNAYAVFEGLEKAIGRMQNLGLQRTVATEAEIRQSILAGKLHQLFKVNGNSLHSPNHENKFFPGHYSAVVSVNSKDYATARLETINSDKGGGFTFADDITLFDRHDLLAVASKRPDLLTIQRHDISRNSFNPNRAMRIDVTLKGDNAPIEQLYQRDIEEQRVRQR